MEFDSTNWLEPFCVACACCSRVCVGYFNLFNVCFQFSFRFRFRCLKISKIGKFGKLVSVRFFSSLQYVR